MPTPPRRWVSEPWIRGGSVAPIATARARTVARAVAAAAAAPAAAVLLRAALEAVGPPGEVVPAAACDHNDITCDQSHYLSHYRCAPRAKSWFQTLAGCQKTPQASGTAPYTLAGTDTRGRQTLTFVNGHQARTKTVDQLLLLPEYLLEFATSKQLHSLVVVPLLTG